MAFITNFFLLCLLKCNLANVKNKYVILRHLGDMCLFTSARINRISPCCLKITYIHTRIIRKRLHPRNNIYVRSVDYTWLFLTTQRIRFWNLESPKCIFSPFWGRFQMTTSTIEVILTTHNICFQPLVCIDIGCWAGLNFWMTRYDSIHFQDIYIHLTFWSNLISFIFKLTFGFNSMQQHGAGRKHYRSAGLDANKILKLARYIPKCKYDRITCDWSCALKLQTMFYTFQI